MSIHNLILNLHTFIILHSFNSSPKKATNCFASKACHAAMRSQWAGGGGGGSRSRCGFGEVQGSSVRFQHVVHAFQRPVDIFFHRDVVRKKNLMSWWWLTGVGNCPILDILDITNHSSHLVDHIPFMVGWCDPWGHQSWPMDDDGWWLVGERIFFYLILPGWTIVKHKPLLTCTS